MSSLTLEAQTAAELMTPNPVSISEQAAIIDAASVLSNRAFSALAVINDAGRPVGVVSRTDIVRREVEPSSTTDVRQIMTATVVSVRPDDPAWEVTENDEWMTGSDETEVEEVSEGEEVEQFIRYEPEEDADAEEWGAKT